MTDHSTRVPTTLREVNTAHIIHSDGDHREALAELHRLMDIDPEAGTRDADELELLALVIEAYEKERFPIGLPDPIEAIRFRMDQQGLRERDLIPFLGTTRSASDVLAGRRPLTLKMIRALHDGLGIPFDVLMQSSHGD
jgi:HTH-type transcriptional regulator / antitoxin HigA